MNIIRFTLRCRPFARSVLQRATADARLSAKLVNELPTRQASEKGRPVKTTEPLGHFGAQNILNHDFVQRRCEGFRGIF
jgi:hypothetical protein